MRSDVCAGRWYAWCDASFLCHLRHGVLRFSAEQIRLHFYGLDCDERVEHIYREVGNDCLAVHIADQFLR